MKDTTSGPPCWMLVKRMLSKNERWIWEARFGKTGGWAGARLPVERDKEVNSYLSLVCFNKINKPVIPIDRKDGCQRD